MRTDIIAPEHLGIGHKLMLAAGLLAAGGFTLVSIAANMRFGVSLATTPFDRVIYATLSIAADLIKIALPLVVAILWRNGERIFACAGAVFWIGAVAFSICAAIGFAASTRSHMLTTGEQQIEKRRAWEAKIVRTEGQIDLLGVHRPASVIQADIDILLRTPGADDCTIVNGPVTREVCPKIDRLKRELAASREAGRLEAGLVADREALSTIPVSTATADPQSAALGELTGFGEGAIRNSVAVLIALLVELGSALGFTLIILAARANAANLGASIPPDALQSAFVLNAPRQHPQAGLHLSDFPTDLVTRWALARLDVISSEVIQAERAYEDFRDWSCAQGARALTPQMFGRRFTAIHKSMGGRKLKRQGRAYYSGVALQAQCSAGSKTELTARVVRYSWPHCVSPILHGAAAPKSGSGGDLVDDPLWVPADAKRRCQACASKPAAFRRWSDLGRTCRRGKAVRAEEQYIAVLAGYGRRHSADRSARAPCLHPSALSRVIYSLRMLNLIGQIYLGSTIVFDEPSGAACIEGGVCPWGLSAGAPPDPVSFGEGRPSVDCFSPSIAGGRMVRPVLCEESCPAFWPDVVWAEALPAHRIRHNVAIAMRINSSDVVRQQQTILGVVPSTRRKTEITVIYGASKARLRPQRGTGHTTRAHRGRVAAL